MGCLLAPFNFIKWAFTSGWKGIIVFAIVVVLLLVGFFVLQSAIKNDVDTNKPAPTATAKAAGIPSVKAAPYLVLTYSRDYYAAKAVKNKDGTVTITDYWELFKDKWTERKGTLVLDEHYGKVIITKRR